MEMKIVNVEGPLIDQTSFQPYMRFTLDLPLSVRDDAKTEEEKALVFYRAFLKATQIFEQTNKSVKTGEVI